MAKAVAERVQGQGTYVCLRSTSTIETRSAVRRHKERCELNQIYVQMQMSVWIICGPGGAGHVKPIVAVEGSPALVI